jgi:hypothetical protein
MNFEGESYPEDRVFESFQGTSDFPPAFDDLLRRRIRTFFRKVKGNPE